MERNFYKTEMVKKDEPMQRHTTFGIGGPARNFYQPGNEAELIEVVAGNPGAFILGGGSNLLVSDGGLEIVISLKKLKSFESAQNEGGVTSVTVGAGLGFTSLASRVWRLGLSGLEFAYGIPGTVGGAVVMNAGAAGGEVKDCLVEAKVLVGGKIEAVVSGDLNLSYRSSSLPKGAVIVSATFGLKKGDSGAILEKMRQVQKMRSETQPLDLPSAGSIFKNPEGGFSGKIIEEAGLKGMREGDAQVSSRHANFIVNLGRATAAQVLCLIEKIEAAVLQKTGIRLEREIKLVGEF